MAFFEGWTLNEMAYISKLEKFWKVSYVGYYFEMMLLKTEVNIYSKHSLRYFLVQTR